MDRFEIEGGVPLKGDVTVGGAKNAALPILAATLLADGPCRLEGVPDLRDIRTMLKILGTLGVRAERQEDGSLLTEVVDRDPCRAPYELVKTMRASICVMGPLVGARGRAEVSFPGGCVIGPRPVDLHIAGLKALGCEVGIEAGYIRAERGPADEMRELYLGGPFGPTVTGTANILSAAVLLPGRTIIQSAACEPEIVDLARFLSAMGARIDGIGSPTLIVDGVERLRGTTWRVVSDRIEAGTLLCAAAMTGGDVRVHGAQAGCLTAPLALLERMGVPVEREDHDVLHVRASGGPAGSRGRRDPAVSGLPDRPPGAVHGVAFRCGRQFLRHREDLPGALHPHRGAPAHGGQHPQGGRDGHRGGRPHAVGLPGHGLGSAGLGRPGGRRAGGLGADDGRARLSHRSRLRAHRGEAGGPRRPDPPLQPHGLARRLAGGRQPSALL